MNVCVFDWLQGHSSICSRSVSTPFPLSPGAEDLYSKLEEPEYLFCLQIHWFSIFNSFMMVIFLTGLVSMILLRTLRADYARYTRDEDDLEALERDMNEESGWKLVHGDVFRSPKYLELLAALIGTGCQLALLILLTILVTIAGTISRHFPLKANKSNAAIESPLDVRRHTFNVWQATFMCSFSPPFSLIKEKTTNLISAETASFPGPDASAQKGLPRRH